MDVQEVVCDLFGCDPILLDDPAYLHTILCTLASKAGTRVVSSSHHTYSPQGVSVMVFVEESHLLISTWPEHGIAVFNCLLTHGPDPTDLVADLKTALAAQACTCTPIRRTWPAEEPPLFNAPLRGA